MRALGKKEAQEAERLINDRRRSDSGFSITITNGIEQLKANLKK